MRNFRRCPLVIMLAVSLLIYGVMAEVPKVLAFAEQRMGKNEYRVESLGQYPKEKEAVSSGGQVSGAFVSDGDISGADVTGNSLSANEVSMNGVSGSEAMGEPVSANNNPGHNEPAFTQVDDAYFADALFIGDSRTVGLYTYSGMEQADFYASTGLTVYKVFDAKIVPVPGSKTKITVEEALKQKQYGKIYFMVGINEMGTGTVDSFMEAYKGVVAHLQELQPDALIFVQAIMRVTTERSDKGDYINNPGIDERNDRIAQLADNEKIFYLDVNPEISDDTGGLVADYTFDGVHLKAEYISIWTDYLAAHGILRE